MATYGYTQIPGDQVTTQAGGTVEIGVAFEATIGFVGGYNAASGSATGGSVYSVDSLSDAEKLFGTDSELALSTKLAYANGAEQVYATPVTETTGVTDSASGSSGTLSNSPIFDPNVNTEHSISAQDTTAGASMTVNIVYDDPPSSPSNSNTMNINPVTGDWNADESSNYDITYDHGDYTSALTDVTGILDEDLRYAVALTENEGVASTLVTELSNRASNFNFMRGVVGGMPNTKPSAYSDALDDQRLAVVQSARGTDYDNNEVRTTGAVAGNLAGNPLGDSATYEDLRGIDTLNGHPTNPTEAGDYLDKQVLPLLDFGDGIKVVKGITTSTQNKFQRIHKVEIVDEATEISHQIAQQFIGEVNIPERQDDLRDSHLLSYRGMANDSLLASTDGTTPYSVNVSTGATDTEVDVEIGLDVVDVMETIDTTINVGDVITAGEQV